MKRLVLVAILLLALLITGLVYLMNTDQRRSVSQLQEAKRAVAGETALVSLPKTTKKVEVPILMYHYIRDYTNSADPLGIQLSVSPLTFQAQLSSLQASGYQSVSLTDFAAGNLPDKPIILTFDDGYLDHYTTVYPLLRQYGFTGTFFVVGNFIGQPGYMTLEQIAELAAAGMEIGGHTQTHRNLARTPYEVAIKEISQSLSHANVFAYPSGQYSYETLDIISGLGIAAAVTTEQGVATTESNLYELPRVRVKEATNIFKKIEEGRGLKVPSKASQPESTQVEYLE